jgi:hypothetical protein
MKNNYKNIFLYVNYSLPLRKQYNFYLPMSKQLKYKILEINTATELEKGMKFRGFIKWALKENHIKNIYLVNNQ